MIVPILFWCISSCIYTFLIYISYLLLITYYFLSVTHYDCTLHILIFRASHLNLSYQPLIMIVHLVTWSSTHHILSYLSHYMIVPFISWSSTYLILTYLILSVTYYDCTSRILIFQASGSGPASVVMSVAVGNIVVRNVSLASSITGIAQPSCPPPPGQTKLNNINVHV